MQYVIFSEIIGKNLSLV